jgi:hypothetical protein
MSKLGVLNSKVFVDGSPLRVSTSPLGDTSFLYKSILNTDFYITPKSPRQNLETEGGIDKVDSLIFSYFQSSTFSQISSALDFYKPNNLDDLKTVLEMGMDSSFLTGLETSLFSSGDVLANFSYRINKITFKDIGKTSLTVSFDSPEGIFKIFFLQVPEFVNPEEYAKTSGFVFMLESSLSGVRCDRYNSSGVHSEIKQGFDIDFFEGENTTMLIGLMGQQSYSITTADIVSNSEYLVPFENLRQIYSPVGVIDPIYSPISVIDPIYSPISVIDPIYSPISVIDPIYSPVPIMGTYR